MVLSFVNHFFYFKEGVMKIAFEVSTGALEGIDFGAQAGVLAYSYRSASIGLFCEAWRAG